jgi:hypothetical protein
MHLSILRVHFPASHLALGAAGSLSRSPAQLSALRRTAGPYILAQGGRSGRRSDSGLLPQAQRTNALDSFALGSTNYPGKMSDSAICKPNSNAAEPRPCSSPGATRSAGASCSMLGSGGERGRPSGLLTYEPATRGEPRRVFASVDLVARIPCREKKNSRAGWCARIVGVFMLPSTMLVLCRARPSKLPRSLRGYLRRQ